MQTADRVMCAWIFLLLLYYFPIPPPAQNSPLFHHHRAPHVFEHGEPQPLLFDSGWPSPDLARGTAVHSVLVRVCLPGLKNDPSVLAANWNLYIYICCGLVARAEILAKGREVALWGVLEE